MVELAEVQACHVTHTPGDPVTEHRVEQAFGLDKPEEEWAEVEAVTLLEADWSQLKTAVENPPPAMCARCGAPLGFGGYPIRPASKLLPYLDAVAEAEKE